MTALWIGSTAADARTPRAYQGDGIRWLVEGRRKFLTDSYGLGKTCQAVWAADTPCIVFTRGYLLGHWAREIKACRPHDVVVVADAARVADRQTQFREGYAAGADWYVCNIEMLRTMVTKTEKAEFVVNMWFPGLKTGRSIDRVRTMIVDESHRLRGRTSQQHAGARAVAAVAERVYLLTATPVYNQPDDLFGQLMLLDPERFKSYYKFIETYMRVWHTSYGPKIMGMRRDKKLKEVFAEYALGRTREEVGAQLPALQETVIDVSGDAAFYKLYRDTRATYRDRYERMLMNQQSVLVALRGLTQQVKLKTVVELVVDAGAKDTLIYTYHRALAEAIGALLKIPVITGNIPARRREEIARSHDMVVATFPSVGEGMDLSHMQNVIYMEHDWQPGALGQATARAYRPGNLHSHVNVYHVVVKNTADAIIYRAAKQRGVTMEEIVQSALVDFEDDTNAV